MTCSNDPSAAGPVPGPMARRPAGRLWALIPCAGAGARARTPVPKQYQPLDGQPMVMHTLAAFAAVDRLAGTLVLVSAGDDFLQPLARDARWHLADCGGATRAATVAGGLEALLRRGAAVDDWVLVHDAARCLITPVLINRLIDACLEDPVGGLLAHPVADTLKLAAGDRVAETTDRSARWLAQTPQMFRLGQLRDALSRAGERVTDESSAIEALGLAPLLVAGSPLNFKLTYPEDFLLAQAVLDGRGGHHSGSRADALA